MGRRRHYAMGFALVSCLAGGFVTLDVQTPSEVGWESAPLDGQAVPRAEGLVLQEERGGETWASMGYAIYRSRDGGPFEKRFTLRPPLGEPWAGFSRLLRAHFGYQELVEVVPLADDLWIVFGGGRIYRVDPVRGRQEEVHRLRYFGRGEGRGVMPHGIAVDDRRSIYYGEYPTGHGRPDRTIRLYRSDDDGRSWQTVHEFPSGFVRHVHGVQWDAFGERLWVSTGDDDAESRIGYSTDRGQTFHWIVEGSQDARACSLLFLRDSVVWGPDAVRPSNRPWRWRRRDGVVEALAGALPGPTYYARPISETSGLLALAELDASVWLVDGNGVVGPVARWPLTPTGGARPHPGVRLARSGGDLQLPVPMNPLRTRTERDAIVRLDPRPLSE